MCILPSIFPLLKCRIKAEERKGKHQKKVNKGCREAEEKAKATGLRLAKPGVRRILVRQGKSSF
jgi:hypothetical protein